MVRISVSSNGETHLGRGDEEGDSGVSPHHFQGEIAYERYQQGLVRAWARGREGEIHKLFYSLVRGRRKPEDFEHYYNQLYRLAPEWLGARIRPRRRLPSEKTPKRIKMN